MSGQTDIPINWNNGSVIVSNGRIFVSPNSTRRTVILPANQPSLTSPFQHHKKRKLTAHDFGQPVWWDNCWGWIGFVPLSPSFLAHPFRCLSWKPQIREFDIVTVSGSSEKRYQMAQDEIMGWKAAEDKIIQACHAIRLAYKIPGETPPPPSELGYPHSFQSVQAAETCVMISRDWFVIWMGFLSYLVCLSQHTHHNRERKENIRCPVWYACLQKAGMDNTWLEGLVQSIVCNFDKSVPRNGLILKLSESQQGRITIQWFLRHNIPVWFLLDAKEEQWLQRHCSLRTLVPPQSMVNAALSELFNDAPTDIKAIVMVHYLNSDLSDIRAHVDRVLRVRKLTTDTFQFCYFALADEDVLKLPSMATSEGRENVLSRLQAAVTHREEQLRNQISQFRYPWPQLLDKGDFQDGQLYEHWSDFFSKQSKRHAELRLSESAQDKQRRLAREKQPSTKKCVVYRWKQVLTGGKILYVCIRVNRRNQEDVLHSFFKKPSYTRRFNPFSRVPEWDLYEYFNNQSPTRSVDGQNLPAVVEDDSDVSDSEDDQSPQELWNEVYGRINRSSSPLPVPVQYKRSTFQSAAQPLSLATIPSLSTNTASVVMIPCSVIPDQADSPVDMGTGAGVQEQGDWNDNEIDVVEYMSTIFGYTPVLDRRLPGAGLMSWGHAMKLVGLPDSLASSSTISDNDKIAIAQFISHLVKGAALDPDLDDLHVSNRRYVEALLDLNESIARVDNDIYVFLTILSPSVDWLLAVKGASAALLVIRMKLANHNHTSLTISCGLLEMGVAFHTLLRLPEVTLKPRLHFPAFKDSAYLNPCGRIFDQGNYDSYRSTAEQMLSRPFGRAALTRGGLIGRIARQYLGFDAVADGPSSEVRVYNEGYIITSEVQGFSYMDDSLTDHEVQILLGTYCMQTKQANQHKIVSWLPPLTAWYESKKQYSWTQWTELDENLFQSILQQIDEGMQPKSRNDWRSWIRAKRAIKMSNVYAFLDHFTERNEAFMKNKI